MNPGFRSGALTLDSLTLLYYNHGLSDNYQALDVMTEWSKFYNCQRPHSALKYLRPVDYYRGNPDARLAEREQKMAQATEVRQAHWAKDADDD